MIFSPADSADFHGLAVARKNHPTKTIFDNSWPIHGNLCLKKTDWLAQEKIYSKIYSENLLQIYLYPALAEDDFLNRRLRRLH